MIMASSSSSSEEKYDVFLSFRGVDTRDNFTSHIYASLCRSKIDTYIDYKLERGDAISPALRRAIEDSKLSVIIFSENYASSSWCLEELVHILKCKKANLQFVLPVFYKIDPSTVRKQTGSFEAAFAEHEIRFCDEIDRVQQWRNALVEASKLSGWDSMVTKPESVLIDVVVQDILKKLRRTSPSSDSKGLVGIEELVERVMPLLSIDSPDVRVLGLWGMGGIGKTTLADTLYNRLFDRFEGGCFLINVREESDRFGLNHLRIKLLSALLGEEIPSTIFARKTYDEERLHRKRVIIVLDDVTDPQQLDTLVGDHDWFAPGSRIILTSRDEQVLKNLTNVHLYKVEELNNSDSLQLFRWNAFKKTNVTLDFMELSERVIKYAKGVPLALTVLGSCLCSKSKREWEKELKKLKMVPNKTVHNVLRISYDGLDATEKDIFLDIACFFKGEDKDLVEKILDECDLFADVGIPNLIRKSLITVVDNAVKMHDLLQEMGWEIVRQESKELGKRSRLWVDEDALRVLKTNTGSAAIEGIFLDMCNVRETDLDSSVFSKMHNLRLLKVYDSNLYVKECKLHFPKGLASLPGALRYFHWYGYPLRSLPAGFSPENLVVLEMPHSQVKRLWNEDQCLSKLRKIDLNCSEHLNQFPDLSQAPNLESMNLGGYISLLQVPSYFQYFERLTDLNLSGNLKLKTLTVIPQSLQCLNLEETGIQELPLSIGSLNNLVTLNLRDCKRLKSLPSATQKLLSLEDLDLHGCSSLDLFPKLPTNIRFLTLSGTAIEQVPSQVDSLSNLELLNLGNCKRLKTVRKIAEPLTEAPRDYKTHIKQFAFVNCLELDENSRHNIMAQAQHRMMHMDYSQLTVCCPGNEIPRWIGHQSEGNSINIELSHGWFTHNFLGFALCVVASFENHKYYNESMFSLKVEFKSIDGQSCESHHLLQGWSSSDPISVLCVDSDHVFLWYDRNLANFVKSDNGDSSTACEASFDFYPCHSYSCVVKRCGLRLLFAQDSRNAMDEDFEGPNEGECGSGILISDENDEDPKRGSEILNSDEKEEEQLPFFVKFLSSCLCT